MQILITAIHKIGIEYRLQFMLYIIGDGSEESEAWTGVKDQGSGGGAGWPGRTDTAAGTGRTWAVIL